MNAVQCPWCESTHIERDYAPARSYALMLLGIALLIPRNMLAHDLFSALGQAHLERLFVFGCALLLYGFADTFRHGQRYCTDCGCRFRLPRRTPKQMQIQIRGGKRSAGKAHAAATESEPASAPDPNTPLEPLLKCLRFKNEKMRADAADTLRRLTGQDFGIDADAWDAWWSENKDEYKASRKPRADA